MLAPFFRNIKQYFDLGRYWNISATWNHLHPLQPFREQSFHCIYFIYLGVLTHAFLYRDGTYMDERLMLL